ncbi:hypothetical protein [Microbulbifer sp. YPW1]|uniref:hypothetical protein n=1 Tax=Microbulbifer sp. YPW1 TaxID=2745199 RepID=UPI001598A770|nr:hypothetical protein [Microbulbifer sp. YPW1]QKX16132.1 hypothetical protein HUW35_03535 [Microbulbifer sp. YPW1]
MKIKTLYLTLFTAISMTIGVFAYAHEGHAPEGVVHEMHHMLWILMALSVSAVAVFLLHKRRNSKSDQND